MAHGREPTGYREWRRWPSHSGFTMQIMDFRQILKHRAAKNELQTRTKVLTLADGHAEVIYADTGGRSVSTWSPFKTGSVLVLANKLIDTKSPRDRADDPYLPRTGKRIWPSNTRYSRSKKSCPAERTNRSSAKNWGFRVFWADTVVPSRIHPFHRSGDGIQRSTQRPERCCSDRKFQSRAPGLESRPFCKRHGVNRGRTIPTAGRLWFGIVTGGTLEGKHQCNSEGNKQSIDMMEYKDFEAVVGPILGSVVPHWSNRSCVYCK